MNNLRYPEDTALLADDKDRLQNNISKVREESSTSCLEINFKKMKIKTIFRDAENKKTEVEVNNEILQQVNIFVYLGT